MKITLIANKGERFANCHISNWVENDLINYEENDEKDGLFWINKKNHILFWTADEIHNSKGININNVDAKHKIMMNLVLPNAVPSFYWSQNENKLNHYKNNNQWLDYKNRTCKSVFLGSYKDDYQGSFRINNDWNNYIEDFHLARNGNYKYDLDTYYKVLANTKYGLCLRGGGPKCWREIEYLALGTVLVITEGVDVENYHNPLVENVHYIKCNDPKDFDKIVSMISENHWNFMSKSCIEWYNNNVYFPNSIKLIENICEKFS